jgi:hypothetical protein
VISLEWGALLIRLGALVLRASLAIWIGGAVILAAASALELMNRGQMFRMFLMCMQCAVPGLVAWYLGGYFWRNAEDLAMPPDFDSEEWSDESHAGQELLTASLVLAGAFLLVFGAFDLVASWYFYESFRSYGSWLEPDSSDDPAAVGALRYATVAAVKIALSLILIFAGRHIAARVTR